MQRYRLREALLLQHNRTPRRAMLRASSMDQLAMNAFRDYLAAEPRTRENRRLLHDIDAGKVVLEPSEQLAIQHAINAAIESVQLIMDMSLHFVRNRTALPFLLSDSPCLFSNHYKRDIRGIGVAGLTHRGLMIIMPVDPQTAILMLDSAVYHPTLPPIVDIVNPRDIEVSNTLQVYEAVKCVYFTGLCNADYACKLVADHPRPDNDGMGGFGIVPGSRDGEDGLTSEVLHVYEPAPPTTLDLSFVLTDPLPNSEDLLRPRCRGLVEQFAPRRYFAGNSLSIEGLVKWVKPRLVVREPRPNSPTSGSGGAKQMDVGRGACDGGDPLRTDGGSASHV